MERIQYSPPEGETTAAVGGVVALLFLMLLQVAGLGVRLADRPQRRAQREAGLEAAVGGPPLDVL